MSERFYIECPFCDFDATHQRPEGESLRPSEAIRLHERVITHLRAEHSKRRGSCGGIQGRKESDR